MKSINTSQYLIKFTTHSRKYVFNTFNNDQLNDFIILFLMWKRAYCQILIIIFFCWINICPMMIKTNKKVISFLLILRRFVLFLDRSAFKKKKKNVTTLINLEFLGFMSVFQNFIYFLALFFIVQMSRFFINLFRIVLIRCVNKKEW